MIATTTDFRTSTYQEIDWFLGQCSAPVVRPISQWVEDELVLPSGPFKGERYRHRRHPASRLWFAALDSGQWNRHAASGPTQNGKTLMCYVAPILYHLFELQETVVIGLPTMAMAQDKWQEDLLPAIEASRYAELLPVRGEGSRNGQVKRAIRFRNDVTLRFMAAGGSDKQRAGYTSRVLAVTETDGMDQAGETSREADAIEQLEGRTRAYGSSKRIYLECTASIEKGRIWQEITGGTNSRIARPCPRCRKYVTPEREHLIGWQDAESELEAAAKATWSCPECAKPWTEKQRFEAAEKTVLVHEGQRVLRNGRIVGEPPKTKTLGFRWSAIDNPFTTAGELGAEEWRARRSHDQDNAEKKQRQFVWCLPYVPPEVDLISLDPNELQRRTEGTRKGQVPDGTIAITVGVDTGKYKLHWHATATRKNGSQTVIEYGEQPTRAKEIGTLKGLIEALGILHAYFANAWRDVAGTVFAPAQVWVDSGYHEHKVAVYEFCRSVNGDLPLGQWVWRPMKGFGERQRGTTRYIAPRKKGGDIRHVGQEYDFRWQREHKVILVHVNSDYWKSQLHQRLAMPAEEPGSLTLYEAPSPDEHFDYSQQITAEVQREEYVEGRGETTVWVRERRNNHFLDAGYQSLAAANFVVEMLAAQQQKLGSWYPPQDVKRPRQQQAPKRRGVVTADGWESG